MIFLPVLECDVEEVARLRTREHATLLMIRPVATRAIRHPIRSIIRRESGQWHALDLSGARVNESAHQSTPIGAYPFGQPGLALVCRLQDRRSPTRRRMAVTQIEVLELQALRWRDLRITHRRFAPLALQSSISDIKGCADNPWVWVARVRPTNVATRGHDHCIRCLPVARP